MWSLETIRSVFYGGVPVVFSFLFTGLIALYIFSRWCNTPYIGHRRHIKDTLTWCTFWIKVLLVWGTITFILYGIEVK